ncbi:MAG TPA: hypothetical protein VGP90_01310 [Acidimicrobiia bacterium]|nr:hypothetical protein [Acidimicrobiia bacterium]
MPPFTSAFRRPSARALVIVAVLAFAAGLNGAGRPAARAASGRAIEVNARRAPSFTLIPLSRREEAVLRSQPELQVLTAGRASGRAKPARSQAARLPRPASGAGAPGRAHTGGGAGQPSGTAAIRLRAPPSPA